MSHGGGDETLDPDLTAMLDLVMQLLMFFIININFVSREMDATVALPTSTSARPEQLDDNALFLNLRRVTDAFRETLSDQDRQRLGKQAVCVTVLGERPRSQLEASGWLADKYRQLKDRAKDTGGEVKTVIHIRPEAELEARDLYLLMRSIKSAGFKKIKVHAILKQGAGT